jgi:hypothetical protein
MIKIDEMTDQEKSVMLARLMGWPVQEDGWIYPDNYTVSLRDLYAIDQYGNPKRFALAWRVLNWFKGLEAGSLPEKPFFYSWGKFEESMKLNLNAADSLHLWLDTVLETAIEAGLVEPETVDA